jgi:hypothetical protein
MIKNKLRVETSASAAGVAALPTILLIGGIIMSISIALTASIYLYISTTSATSLSLKALSVARSGIYDGLMKVSRNKNLSSASYAFTVGNLSALVDICQGTPDCGGSGKFKISSIGSALTTRKKMEAIVSVDGITGEVKLERLEEVAL